MQVQKVEHPNEVQEARKASVVARILDDVADVPKA